MAAPTTDHPRSELEELEEAARAHLDDGGLDVDDTVELDDQVVERPPLRLAFAIAFPTVASGILVGGVFLGAAAGRSSPTR